MVDQVAQGNVPPPASKPTILGLVAAVWGAGGVFALLLFAGARLSAVVAAGLDFPWQTIHIVAAAANAAFMAWSEGHRGFGQRFSPRSAARLQWLLYHPSPTRALFAPLFVMGYFHATRRLRVVVYSLTVGILAAIAIVHALPQPWRAALDIGVVIGLAWGAASFAWSLRQTLAGRGEEVSPELPAGGENESSRRTC